MGKLRSTVLALLGVGLLPLAAEAQIKSKRAPTAPDLLIAMSFFAADTDHDGTVSKAELARDVAAAFARLDSNRDQFLEPDELAAYDRLRFAEIDINHDGRLDFAEVMTAKLADFAAMDKNGDGVLTLEEVMAFTPHAWEAKP